MSHSEFTDEKDVIIVTAEASTDQTLNGKPTKTGSATGPATESAKGPTSQSSAEAAAAPLDLFLPDAAVGMLRRFGPDSATTRWALKLASNPGTVIRRVTQLTADLAAIAAGSSEIKPPRRDRRFADTA